MNSLSSDFSFDFSEVDQNDEQVHLEDLKIKNKEKLAGIFKIGTYIEINQDLNSENFFQFFVLKHLGFGSYGIVILVSAKILSKQEYFKERKNSIKMEVSDQNSKKFFKKCESLTLEHDNYFAIKIIDLEANDLSELEDPVSIARREINLMSELQDCDRILKYYVTFTSTSFLFIVMEYAEGGSLYNIYNKYGSFPEELIASVIKDIVIALERLHNQNKNEYIIHNDLKSANILLSEHCIAKLADFGVSKKVYADTKNNQKNNNFVINNEQEMLGSPFWMAPETITGSNPHFSSDIWSLGITTLELAFGRIPWPTFKKLEDLLSHILKSQPPQKNVKQDVQRLFSSEFWDFINSCLQKNPEQRKSADLLLKHPFLNKSKTPNSIDNFIKIVCGNQINKTTYIDSFIGYINGFFHLKSGDRNNQQNQQNVSKNKSISISRYFSRKKSSQVQRNFSLCKSLSLNNQKSNSIQNKNENQLNKRISAKHIYKCLDSPVSKNLEAEKSKSSDSLLIPNNELLIRNIHTKKIDIIEKEKNRIEDQELVKTSAAKSKNRNFKNICSCFKVGKI